MIQKLKSPKEAKFSYSVARSHHDVQQFNGWDCWLISPQTCISYALISFSSVSGRCLSVLCIQEKKQSNHDIRPLRERMEVKILYAGVMKEE